jgi:hypothetical protein
LFLALACSGSPASDGAGVEPNSSFDDTGDAGGLKDDSGDDADDDRVRSDDTDPAHSDDPQGPGTAPIDAPTAEPAPPVEAAVDPSVALPEECNPGPCARAIPAPAARTPSSPCALSLATYCICFHDKARRRVCLAYRRETAWLFAGSAALQSLFREPIRRPVRCNGKS